MEKKEKKISEKKKEIVNELINLIKSNRTIMIASISGISAKHLQDIKKSLKKEVIIKVLKKSLVDLALKKFSELEELRRNIDKNFALLITKEDPFEIAYRLKELRTFIKARPNQFLEEDIIIPAGVTEIMAGPVITEFTNAKIKVGIEQGRISIKEPFIIKRGEKISLEIANILEKLEIKPISSEIKPIIAYDFQNKKIYKNIKINKEEALNSIILASKKAFNLAININFICKETITTFLNRARLNALNLKKIIEQKT